MRAIYLLALAIFVCSCDSETAATEESAATEEATEMARGVTVPDVVKEAFAVAHPDATDIEWEVEASMYEVEFEHGDLERTIIYNADGTMYAAEQDISVSALPKAVAQAAAANGEADEVCQITMADGTIQYEVGIGKREYNYATDGTLLGEEMDNDDEEEDDDDGEDD